jgi:hypothetical protein
MVLSQRNALRLLGGLAVVGILPFVIGSTYHPSVNRASTIAPPPEITDPTDPAQRSAVLAYARSLKFDDFTQGASAENLLDTLGTVGRLYPEVDNGRLREADFPRGRIQLRVEILPSREHPDVGFKSFGAGASYIWVDNFRVSDGSGTARGIIIPVDSTQPATVVNLTVHGGLNVETALARWTLKGVCWSCESGGWCH